MPIKKLTDGTQYVKATYWEGEVLKGAWVITRKIDGVRALRDEDGNVVSRNSKPLLHLDHLDFEDAEIFRKDIGTTVSMLRSHTAPSPAVTQNEVYELGLIEPGHRLYITTIIDPTEAQLQRLLQQQLELGHEGLVMRNGNTWKKAVPKIKADVRITGWYEGKTGSNIGKLGGFTTDHGKIGGGFTKEFRNMEHTYFDDLVGQLIQVSYREKTAAGKMRFGTFERVRWDKNEESI